MNLCRCGCGRSIPDFGVKRPIQSRLWFNGHSPRKRREPVFSPLEKSIRQNLRSKKWQSLNPAKVQAQRSRRWARSRDKMMAQNKKWCRLHRKERNRTCRRAYVEMRPYYLKQLLKFHGIENPTAEQLEEQRRRCISRRRKSAILRSSQALGMLGVCASLTKR